MLIVPFRAFEMMKNRGQRSWSVGLSMADITNSILTDKNKIHSVSTLAQVEQLWLLFSCYASFSQICHHGQTICTNASTTLPLGLVRHRCGGVPQLALQHGLKRVHATGWSFPGARGGRQAEGQRHLAF